MIRNALALFRWPGVGMAVGHPIRIFGGSPLRVTVSRGSQSSSATEKTYGDVMVTSLHSHRRSSKHTLFGTRERTHTGFVSGLILSLSHARDRTEHCTRPHDRGMESEPFDLCQFAFCTVVVRSFGRGTWVIRPCRDPNCGHSTFVS